MEPKPDEQEALENTRSKGEDFGTRILHLKKEKVEKMRLKGQNGLQVIGKGRGT